MGFKNSIKKKITDIIISIWPLPEHKPSGKPVNIRVGKTALVFSFSTEEELSDIKTFITLAKQYSTISAIVAFSNEINTHIPKYDVGIFYISQNDFNLFGRIKNRFKVWLIKNDFDLLISFASKSELFCDKIISNISSEFKAGNFDQGSVNLFDLTIRQKSDNFVEQFEQFNHYFDKLNIRI